VKTFVGTTENALFIQIWTAPIAMLLIKHPSRNLPPTDRTFQ
jgi:hypothetical protein